MNKNIAQTRTPKLHCLNPSCHAFCLANDTVLYSLIRFGNYTVIGLGGYLQYVVYNWLQKTATKTKHSNMKLDTTKYTLNRISNWPPSFCYILGKVFGEKIQITK